MTDAFRSFFGTSFPGHVERLELKDRLRAASDGYDIEVTALRRRLRRLAGPTAVSSAAAMRSRMGVAPKLLLPAPATPRVSIIVPVYNHFEVTWSCLESLAHTPQSTTAEIIVVDDRSTDETARMLASIEGIRVVHNAKNLGFIGACNAGAAISNAEYLCFLNNDTTVTPNWLDELIGTFDFEPRAGLVGGQLLYPDGRLQEAGGIIWRDATGANYGRLGDPERPEFNYLREVDYCSGACIVVPRPLFEHLGGFDRHYAPAYYEDTDLAFRVRAEGRMVLMQPRARVFHFEGVSSGTDLNSGVKRHQVENRIKFLERHRAVLEAEHEVPSRPQRLAKDRRPSTLLRLLVIDSHVPRPDHDSGSLRMYQLLTLARQAGIKVSFVSCEDITEEPNIERYVADLRRHGVEMLTRPYVVSPRHALRLYGDEYDAVLLSRVDTVSRHLDAVRRHAPRARIVFDTVDLHYVREQSEAELRDDEILRRRAAERKKQELWATYESDVTLTVSESERDLLRAECPGANVMVLSNIHQEFPAIAGFAERRDVLFVGGFRHPPNCDAAIWFVEQVMPKLRGKLGDGKLYIVGSEPTAAVRALATSDVIVTGQVRDLGVYFERARLSVAPLRFGAGVKGKINMSMSYGVPVVATSLAVEGMSLVPERDVLVADGAKTMAEAIVRLHGEPVLFASLAENGRASVRARFSREAALAVLIELRKVLVGR